MIPADVINCEILLLKHIDAGVLLLRGTWMKSYDQAKPALAPSIKYLKLELDTMKNDPSKNQRKNIPEEK